MASAAAATGSLGNGERAPSGGSAGAVAAVTRVLDDGEHAPLGGGGRGHCGCSMTAGMRHTAQLSGSSSCTGELTPSFLSFVRS